MEKLFNVIQSVGFYQSLSNLVVHIMPEVIFFLLHVYVV